MNRDFDMSDGISAELAAENAALRAALAASQAATEKDYEHIVRLGRERDAALAILARVRELFHLHRASCDQAAALLYERPEEGR